MSKERFTSRMISASGRAHIDAIVDKAGELSALFDQVIVGDEPITADAVNYIALAQTALEQAVMWANKGISRAPQK